MLQHSVPSPSKPQPRRPPAHISVSLHHDSLSPASSACSRRAQPAQDDEAHKLTAAWRVSPVLQSSEESNESADTPADAWFDRSNKNVGSRLGQPFVDNDPPFFLQNQTYIPPPSIAEADVVAPSSHAFASTKSQFAPEHIHAATNGSSPDEFRSVIDDLTIENKKLKERLRKYEKLYSSPIEKDKLFEVKVYGLSPSKKRELEEILLAFASSIGKGEPTRTSTSHRPMKDLGDRTVPFRQSSKNASSSSTSNSRLVDSAYASLSTSVPGSLSVSNHAGNGKRKGGDLMTVSNAGKVQSFLADIPPGLLPKHSIMTERGKKKLVVRRLEQIFTGKMKAPAGPNDQPLQQQEVSNSAARDDRRAIRERGQQIFAEGVREAHILSSETELEKTAMPKLPGEPSGDSPEGAETGTPSPGSPNQRPTRPLDLDPDRAQVPADNIEYIRHLGISTPDVASEDLTDAEDGHGWVYLNLLINMAQLHIINVTLDFVRSAISEMSTKFQLSSDGSKIRWKGGMEGTELSSDSGGDNALRDSPNNSDSLDGGDKKRCKIDNSSLQVPGHGPNLKQGRFSATLTTPLDQPNLPNARKCYPFYKPLFAHHSSTEDEDMSYDSTSQISYVHVEGTHGGEGGSYSRSSSKRKRGDGAIVFYNGGNFCTDLSGDRVLTPTPVDVGDVGMDGFSNRSHDALGCTPASSLRLSPSRSSHGSGISVRSFKDYSVCAEPLTRSEERSWTPEVFEDVNTDELEFPPVWTGAEEQEEYTPMSLDVCGLGGTRPADHFAIIVKTRRRKLNREARNRNAKFSVPRLRSHQFLHPIPKSAVDIFRQPDTDRNEAGIAPYTNPVEPLVNAEILSTTVQYLDPSKLPPPATYHWALTSSTEWSDDTSSDGGNQQGCGVPQQSLFLRQTSSTTSVHLPIDAKFSNNEEDRDEDSSSQINTSDSSSIDMLAYARKAGP